MKYIVKQINPEYQKSPFYTFREIEGLENIFIFGNRDFCGVNVNEYDEFINQIESVLSAIDDGFGETYWQYESFEECLKNELYGSIEMNEKIIENWEKLLNNDFDIDSYADICNALGLYTGKEWDYTIIKGCCQGDWQNVIYCVDDWSNEDIKRIEIEYFNLGSKWLICENPIEDEELTSEDFDIDNIEHDFSMYCYSWNDNGIKEEIADCIGCNVEDVVLFKFNGYTRIANYTMI